MSCPVERSQLRPPLPESAKVPGAWHRFQGQAVALYDVAPVGIVQASRLRIAIPATDGCLRRLAERQTCQKDRTCRRLSYKTFRLPYPLFPPSLPLLPPRPPRLYFHGPAVVAGSAAGSEKIYRGQHVPWYRKYVLRNVGGGGASGGGASGFFGGGAAKSVAPASSLSCGAWSILASGVSMARPAGAKLRQRIGVRRAAAAGDSLCPTARRKPTVGAEAVTQQHLSTEQISNVAGSTPRNVTNCRRKANFNSKRTRSVPVFTTAPSCPKRRRDLGESHNPAVCVCGWLWGRK